MQKRFDKNAILQACIQKQQKIIDDYTKEVDSRNADAFTQRESASQSEERSGIKLDVLAAMNNELAFVKQEMVYLSSPDVKTERETVGPGAVVATNHLTFFVDVSSEKVEVDSETIFGISTKAPLYQEMKDLKKGDTFQFNDRTYKIEDLY